MTFAILPRLQRSTVSAEKIHLQGYEIILHQPMEPHDPNVDPGPGALYVGDKHQKIY
ncbi:divergent polysaccharide deacetylase family protein [Thermodesulfobacteriota bacterium]